MYISISNSTSKKLSSHVYFRPVEVTGWQGLAGLVCSHVWSPIVWSPDGEDENYGRRVSTNFKVSYFAGVDVDDGLALDDALRFLKEKNFGHVLATTKSHGIAKNGEEPRDRFRIVFRWQSPIRDLELYQYNMKRLAEAWQADRSATDGARMFQPCRDIISVQQGQDIPLSFKPKPSYSVLMLRRFKSHMLKASREPSPWAEAFLNCGRLDSTGGRKRTIYSVACELTKVGWSEAEIVSAIRSAPISWDGIDERIVSQAVKSAARRFRG